MPERVPEEVLAKPKRKVYENQLRKVQTESCRLQDWVVHEGWRVVVVLVVV
jgi:hypothetical protein